MSDITNHERYRRTRDALQAKIMTNGRSLVEFAELLIATPSENPPGDERAVAHVIGEKLREFGVTDFETLSDSDRRPNILCQLRGITEGRKLLYNGHMDTKPAGDLTKWKSNPFKPIVRDGRLFGLGATDMKSAVAALVYAFGMLQEYREHLAGELTLALTADEEAGGRYGAGLLAARKAIEAGFALVAEPSGIDREWQYLDLGSRGESCFRVTVRGTRTHSCLADRLPTQNACLKMADILTRLKRELTITHAPHRLYPSGITITPAVMMKGGEFYGIVPDAAEFVTEIRVLPGMSRESIWEDLQRFAAAEREGDPSLDMDIAFVDPPMDWIAPHEVPEGHQFVKILEATAGEVLPIPPEVSLFPAWTDGRYFAHECGIPTIPAFGPGLLPLAHSPNEFIAVRSIVQACEIYALSAFEYLWRSDQDGGGYGVLRS